ncbi:hypothetical protein ALQ94_04170 [Pseudomonas amygdali pv. morsprunorum]|uniref:Uncharacterized protein n=1 Tax=Pseudomonas amygdali pv. morsprunorum TaxID=129138 RepID=A0A3M2WSQ5_PSEA0|nr:hypothetical protein ALQ94_04170 [Pseudomonas amygdali pv. morsprunorum]
MERDRAHLANGFQDPISVLDRKVEAFVALKELDIGENVIADPVFVVYVKNPALIVRISPSSFPLGQPAAPVLPPFLFRLDLYQHWFRIVVIVPVTEMVVDKKIWRVLKNPAIPAGEINLYRLRNDGIHLD